MNTLTVKRAWAFQFALMRVSSSRFTVAFIAKTRSIEFQFALMRVSSSREKRSGKNVKEKMEFQFALMRVSSSRSFGIFEATASAEGFNSR